MKMKPRVFIGSASAAIENVIHLVANFRGHELDITSWHVSDDFQPGSGTWENLVRAIEQYDFAIFLFTPDDNVERPDGKFVVKSRDNVVLEFGLFTGKLGRDRVFLLKQSDGASITLPSDLFGVQYLSFVASDGKAGMMVPANDIAQRIAEVGNVDSKSLFKAMTPESIEEIFQVTGLNKAYEARMDALPDILDDIKSAKSSIRIYSRVYQSELTRAGGRFASSVAEAISKMSGTLTISSTAVNPNRPEQVKALHVLEDPDSSTWHTTDAFREHMVTANRKVANLGNRLKSSAGDSADRIVFGMQILNDIMPFSLLAIDESVVYVSFYKLSPERNGTNAPTVRLVNDQANEDWADIFIKEAAHMDKRSKPLPEDLIDVQV